MDILNISKLKLNDKHNYYGGAIGNIAYNLLHAISEIRDVNVISFTEGVDLERAVNGSLKFFEVKSFANLNRRMDKILINNDISVVTHFYFHEPEYNPIAGLVKKRGFPFVIGMCELPHPRFNDELSGILKIPFVRTLGKSFILPKFKGTLELCDVLIVVNEGAKNYYSRFIEEEKIRIIPYGVDLVRFRYSPLLKGHKILLVSRLIKRRGLDYMVDAMPEIIEEFPDTELHFVGEGPRKEILRRRAEMLDVGSKVFFHGNVQADRLVELYRDCYVFCHLSFADGWNQPALEAMATGRPVICTDAPHNSMIEDGKTGFLVPFGDVDMLTEKIIYLFGANHSLAEKMGMEGRKVVESKYNWDKIAEIYHKVLQEVRL